MEKKFSYNPFNKDFIQCAGLHAISLKDKLFKDYIRSEYFSEFIGNLTEQEQDFLLNIED
jgi:hypothetical protein